MIRMQMIEEEKIQSVKNSGREAEHSPVNSSFAQTFGSAKGNHENQYSNDWSQKNHSQIDKEVR